MNIIFIILLLILQFKGKEKINNYIQTLLSQKLIFSGNHNKIKDNNDIIINNNSNKNKKNKIINNRNKPDTKGNKKGNKKESKNKNKKKTKHFPLKR